MLCGTQWSILRVTVSPPVNNLFNSLYDIRMMFHKRSASRTFPAGSSVRHDSFFAVSRLSLCCCPRLVWRAVAVIAVWTHMIVGRIGEFLHSLVQFLLRPEFIQVGAFVLQGVEVPLHWRIIVWVSGFAHALGHMGRPAELYESL